ncbi:NAD/NADP-dependent octopine/nopaline dehydrogenase family protein [Psychrobacter pygoscelis]|uniref:NAD/NADP-dependent octopine/nopaline dehydrogenase family protein n=1 Tax=Psychrobacter pygoscelis TaxID=2488563 RepID=UPI00103E4825|nr:NAD/NADP-dependent octopine/nopaline dehydrogenase family protein [Psychrobacter pygoscelis]
MNITIFGAGRIGHLLTIRFANKGAKVNVLTQNRYLIDKFEKKNELWRVYNHKGEVICGGKPELVTSDPRIALENSDIILLTAPSNSHSKLIKLIKPYLPRKRKIYIGAMPGCGGFDWRCRNLIGKDNKAIIWGFKDVSHIASNLVHGDSVLEGGAKSKLFIAMEDGTSEDDSKCLLERLNCLFDSSVELLSSFMEITLTPGNALMHPPVLYALSGVDGDYTDNKIYPGLEWWSDISKEAAELIEACDTENQAIKNEVESVIKLNLSSVCSLSQELKDAYGSMIKNSSSMYNILRSNKAYEGIKFPSIEDKGILIPDPASRVFFEDIEIGLAVLIALGRTLGVNTPNLNKIHSWGVAWHKDIRDLTTQIIPNDWMENYK